MDKPIDISKLCLDKLKKIKSTDKYENIKQCVNIYPKKIQKETKSKVIGEKCRAYLQKQANTTKKITKTQLNQNCEVIAQVHDQKKGKGKGKQAKGRKGRGGRGGSVNDKKLLEQNKAQVPAPVPELNSTEKKLKGLEIDLGKYALMGDEKKYKETMNKITEIYCGKTAEIGYNVITGTFNAIFNSFQKGKLPSIGWDGGKYLLGTDIATALKSIGVCLTEIGFTVKTLKRINSYLSIWRGSGEPPKRGSPPDNPDFGGGGGGDDRPPRPPRPPDKKDEEEEEEPRRTAPPSTQLQPQGQAQPTQPTTADVLLAQQRQQIGRAYQAQATAQSKALEEEISQSSLRDQELMQRKGLIQTPQGIMTREQWEQFKKGEEALKEEEVKQQTSSWSDLFSDIAEDIGKGVAVAGGLTLPLASVANILRGQQGGLTAEQARQANIDFANQPPFPQEGQPRQPQPQPRQPQAQRGQGQETGEPGQPKEQPAEAERGEGQSAEGEPRKKDSPPKGPRGDPIPLNPDFIPRSRALLGIGAGALLGGARGKTREGALLGALGATSLFRPQTEGGEAVSLEEDMISRAVEGSMLGGREEEGGEKPRATYLRPRQLTEQEAEQRLEDIGQPAEKEEEEAEDRSLAEYHRDWEARMRGRIRSRTAEMLLGGTRNPVDRMLSEAEETKADTESVLEELGALQASEAVGARPQYLDDYMGETSGGFMDARGEGRSKPPENPADRLAQEISGLSLDEPFYSAQLPSGEFVGMSSSEERARPQVSEEPYSPSSITDIEALERFEQAVKRSK
jgi:hypothetical protein